MKLSTNDLRLIAEKLLQKVDPNLIKELKLTDDYIRDLRDALLEMAEGLDSTGEFDMVIQDDIEDAIPISEEDETKEDMKVEGL